MSWWISYEDSNTLYSWRVPTSSKTEALYMFWKHFFPDGIKKVNSEALEVAPWEQKQEQFFQVHGTLPSTDHTVPTVAEL
jgi:hypothetical protein